MIMSLSVHFLSSNLFFTFNNPFMKTVEIIGYKRANLGKSESKRLREEGNVPCVLYGGKEQIAFYTPAIFFRDVVYTSEARFVELNIEGDIHRAILQDVQFHPVNEMILHADFLELFDNKFIKMDIPILIEGTAPGVMQGGKIISKLKYITVSALPKNMPDFIRVDVSDLGLGKSIRVGDVQANNFTILNSPLVTICSVEVPRAMRGKVEEGAEAGK
jgi:large subunit ribosomal protein L25